MEEECSRRERLAAAAPALADWFLRSARALPWRADRDPYRILVSEIMLQQTRIEAVIPRYEAFLRMYPDLAALAAAPEEELMKAWEGLGYYSRARNLQKAARQCRDLYGSTLPGSFRELRKLPGLGDYTAGAVASMGFGEAVPAVDGNVLRVLSRLLLDRRDVTESAVKKAAGEDISAALQISGVSPGAFNEGLMELGETLCLPKGSLLCEACPVRPRCLAFQAGCAGELPYRRAAGPRRTEEKTLLLSVVKGRVGLEKRPEKGLLSGLYGFPLREGSYSGEALTALLAEDAALAAAGPFTLREAGSASHSFTHVEWRMRGFILETERELPGLLYVTAGELATRYALPSAFRFYKTVYLREYAT